jgi:hypothetical protein
LYYHEWLQQDWKALLTPGAEVPEPLIPNIHTCPEPFPRIVAESLAQFHASTGIPVHPVVAARIRLGLEA